MSTAWTKIPGQVCPGYGVASGSGRDPRYPEGTLALQWPHFLRLGLPLERIYRGTLNIDISPHHFSLIGRDWCFPSVDWSPYIAAETFSFSRCQLNWQGRTLHALIYYPHPETKPEHFQSDTTLEILAPRIEGLSYGDQVELRLNPAHIEV